MKKVWNGWLQERKHNKYFTDRMKKIDKKCVDEIERNEHLTGEDYASSILEDMDEFEIRGPFLNWLRLSGECDQFKVDRNPAP